MQDIRATQAGVTCAHTQTRTNTHTYTHPLCGLEDRRLCGCANGSDVMRPHGGIGQGTHRATSSQHHAGTRFTRSFKRRVCGQGWRQGVCGKEWGLRLRTKGRGRRRVIRRRLCLCWRRSRSRGGQEEGVRVRGWVRINRGPLGHRNPFFDGHTALDVRHDTRLLAPRLRQAHSTRRDERHKRLPHMPHDNHSSNVLLLRGLCSNDMLTPAHKCISKGVCVRIGTDRRRPC